jgi:hypothetical protein
MKPIKEEKMLQAETLCTQLEETIGSLEETLRMSSRAKKFYFWNPRVMKELRRIDRETKASIERLQIYVEVLNNHLSK